MNTLYFKNKIIRHAYSSQLNEYRNIVLDFAKKKFNSHVWLNYYMVFLKQSHIITCTYRRKNSIGHIIEL